MEQSVYDFLKDWCKLIKEAKQSISIEDKLWKYGVHFTCLNQEEPLIQTIVKVLEEKFNVNPYEQIIYLDSINEVSLNSINQSYTLYFISDSYNSDKPNI